MSGRDWARIIVAVGFFTLAVVHILALRLPRFGRWALGTAWPELIADSARKRVKTRRWILQAAGCALFGLGWTVEPMVSVFTASEQAATIAAGLRVVAAVLALVCWLRAVWLDRQL